ncbi:MAG: hypothetical protein ABI867_26310 [Kofleriaceae bacterium]
MRPLWGVIAFLAACGGNPPHQRMPDGPNGSGGELADEDRFVPTYAKPDLQRALIAERGLEATGEKTVAELDAKASDTASQDRLRVAVADLGVRRRFIRALEVCEASGRWCPPRLDEPAWNYDYDGDRIEAPPVDATLRFDLDSWRTLTGELHGRACACRTMLCVDSVGVAIDRLEKKPMPDVQGDELASLAITRARECLFRLRGKSIRDRSVVLPSES